MTDTVKFDVTGLADLAEDLRGAGQRYSVQVSAIMKRGAQNIKEDSKKRFTQQRTGPYMARYASHITYDITITGGKVVAEIGPEMVSQGNFGLIMENGSANNAPKPHLGPALDAEVPKTEAQLQVAAVRSVLR